MEISPVFSSLDVHLFHVELMLLTLRSIALPFLHLSSYLNLIVQLGLLSYLTRMVLFYLTFKLEDLLLYLLTR